VQRKEGVMQPYPTPGSELAGYRIEALLGRGGMAVVYLAEHLRLGRKAALKLLAPELAGDEQFQQRFVRESQLAAAIDHPNIIPIYDAGEADGLLYIAMRYVAGTDLRARLKQAGRLDPDRIVAVLGQVAGALDAAHAHGLVHRDVKPANILLGPGPGAGPDDPEHVYLSDFGLTKRSASASGMTATGLFVGTLDYAAPEQIEGKPVDGRTDVYALGCVLFECLTGLPPYRYDEDRAVMWAHLVGEIPQVTAHRPELPAGVDEVVARALAKLPDDRYPTCRAMISELGTVLAAGLGGAAQQPTAMPNKPLAEVQTPAAATESEAAVLALWTERDAQTRHKDPSPDLVQQLVSELSSPGGGNNFLIIEREDRPQSYAQTARNAASDYLVEYRDGGATRHFAASHLSLSEAQAAVCGWAFNLPGWRERFQWIRVTFGDSAATRAGGTADLGRIRGREGTWGTSTGTPHDDAAAMSAPAVKPPDPSRTEAPKAPERSEQVSRGSTASIPLVLQPQFASGSVSAS